MIRECKVVEVIRTVSLEGRGESGDPSREVVSYWSLEGELLVEIDRWKDQQQGDNDDGIPF